MKSSPSFCNRMLRQWLLLLCVYSIKNNNIKCRKGDNEISIMFHSVEALVFSRPFQTTPQLNQQNHRRHHLSTSQNEKQRQVPSFKKGLYSPLLFAYKDDYSRGGVGDGAGGSGDEMNKNKKDSNCTMTLPSIPSSSSTTSTTTKEAAEQTMAHDFDFSSSSKNNKNHNNNNNTDNSEFESLSAETALLFRDLRQRQTQLHLLNSMENWKQSKCTLNTRITLNDFVRRIAMLPPSSSHQEDEKEESKEKKEEEVMAVCGGSRGGLYLLDLKNGKVEDEVKDAHNAQDTYSRKDTNIWKAMYGSFDGGGVVSLAMGRIRNKNKEEKWVASSGREGGASVWRIITNDDDDDDDSQKRKKFASRIPLEGLHTSNDDNDEKVLVTCLSFDTHQNHLWVGCADGKIRLYQFIPSSSSSTVPKLVNTFSVMPSCSSSNNNDNDEEDIVKEEVEYPAILGMYICNELNCGVCVSAASSSYSLLSTNNDTNTRFSGSVHIFPLQQQEEEDEKEEEKVTRMIQPFRDGVHARSVCIVRNNLKVEEQQEEEENSDSNTVSAEKYSMICGGSDGSLYSIPLNVKINPSSSISTKNENDKHNDYASSSTKAAATTAILWSNPFHYIEQNNTKASLKLTNKMRPSHTGPVMCLTPHPFGGLFISGGQDGTIRVWSCNNNKDDKNNNNNNRGAKQNKSTQHAPSLSSSTESSKQQKVLLPKCRYALFGYKFWLGSICTDGLRLVVDGTDKYIAVRDYSSSSTSTSLDTN